MVELGERRSAMLQATLCSVCEKLDSNLTSFFSPRGDTDNDQIPANVEIALLNIIITRQQEPIIGPPGF